MIQHIPAFLARTSDNVSDHVSAAVSAATLLLAVLGLIGCKDAPPPAPPEPAAPIVQAGQLRFPPGHPQLALLGSMVATPPGKITIELPARLVWNEERTQRIVPSFAGRVTAIAVDVGRSVGAGTVLARIASPDFGAAQADAAKARADADFTRKALARQRELFDAGIAARKDFEQAEADAQRAAAELARAHSRVALYGNAGSVDQQLGLRSTLAGIVVERNLNPGQELRPDQQGPGVPPLFVISDPTSLWVQIDARESESGTLKPGSAFTLVVPSLGERVFEGRVTAVSDAIDPNTRTLKLRGVVANPERILRAEMLATARFDRVVGSGVVVPAQAVVLNGTRHAVFIQSAPGVFEPREVRLGYQGPTQVVVSGGLEVGERVVSENLLLLARQYRLAQEEGQAAPEAARSTAGSTPGPTAGSASVSSGASSAGAAAIKPARMPTTAAASTARP
jgi:cobalt-zinc-cadmium efflux system membrane fusion protein